MDKKSNKLIALLVTFDKQQRKHCRKLLESPYFNPNKDLVRLFDELCRRLQLNAGLEKEAIWRKLFKEKAYNDTRFRKFTSDLYRLLQTFIVQEELQQREDQRKLLYLQAIDRQYPRKIVDGILRNWEKEIAQPIESLGESADRYHYRYLAENQLFRLSRFDIRTHERSNLDQIGEHLDVFYLAEKLRTYYSSRSTDHARQQQYNTTLIPEIVAYLRRNEYYRNYLPVAVYYHSYLMDTEPEKEEHFIAFKKLLIENAHRFSKKEATELYTNALNYCIFNIRRGKSEYERQYIEIYQELLDHQRRTKTLTLNPVTFKNAIQIALRVEEYDWVESYIRDYQLYLPEKQRSIAVNYNMAALHFYQRNYREAIGFLSQVDYEDPIYTLNSRTMLTAAYYELDEYEALESTFDAFSAYLNRHKELPQALRSAYRTFISITRRLSRTLPGDEKAIAKLRDQLAEEELVASRGWVVEKVEELAAA